MSKETSTTVRLASYASKRRPDQLLNTAKVWEAARATSAATSFFDPITIGMFKQTFVDGATGASNPVYEVWNEAKDIWSSASFDESVGCLVSIGTGIPPLGPLKDDPFSIAGSLLQIATETEKTNERFCQDKRTLYDQDRFHRFNVNSGLEAIGLEESSRKNEIISATNLYVASQAVMKQMKACVGSKTGKRS